MVSSWRTTIELPNVLTLTSLCTPYLVYLHPKNLKYMEKIMIASIVVTEGQYQLLCPSLKPVHIMWVWAGKWREEHLCSGIDSLSLRIPFTSRVRSAILNVFHSPPSPLWKMEDIKLLSSAHSLSSHEHPQSVPQRCPRTAVTVLLCLSSLLFPLRIWAAQVMSVVPFSR